MNFELYDWLVVAAYMAAMLWIGVAVHKRGSNSLTSFFTGDRNLPWWLAASSLIATSFCSDTPLWVTGLIRTHGIHAVWQYWTYFLGAGLAVFLFARMWRRAGVVTDNEVLEVRYSGSSAAFIRGFNAGWGAMVMNIITIGWATKAMLTIMEQMLGLTGDQTIVALAVIVVITVLYCAASGLYGVMITDAIQLVLGLIGTIALAGIALYEVGGVTPLVTKLQALEGWNGRSLSLGPVLGSVDQTPPGALSIWNFIALIGFAWLGLSYCSGYMCQRLLACKNERHASGAMLGYTLFYWGFLAWPWIIVALCSLVLLDPVKVGTNHETAYPLMAATYLPVGLRGVLFMALLAAYMSTIATLINFGSSYIVNDLYQRFLVKGRDDQHYLRISRLATGVMAIAGALVAWSSESVLQLLSLAGAFGIGSVLIPALRWFWWRMTPWGEFAAFVVSVVMVVLAVACKIFDPLIAHWLPLSDAAGGIKPFSSDWDYFGLRILLVMIPCTLTAIIVSLCTKPTDDDRLREFITRLRPPTLFWGATARRLKLSYEPGETLTWVLTGWASMTACIAGMIYGLGWCCLGRWWEGCLGLTVCAVSLWFCLYLTGRADQSKKA